MRGVFVRTVNEDLTAEAQRVSCRTLLLYGRDDVDTPPEIGERLQRLMPNAELQVLNGLDHHTVLTSGRHQVVNEITRFVGQQW
jgi:pimeloyl-ACP methyl ester carboxylesterase